MLTGVNAATVGWWTTTTLTWINVMNLSLVEMLADVRDTRKWLLTWHNDMDQGL